MRVSNASLNELIANHGELSTSPLNALGILRLALDLRDARAALNEAPTFGGSPKTAFDCEYAEWYSRRFTTQPN